MDAPTLKIAFLIGLVSSSIIRIPYQKETKHNITIDNRKTAPGKCSVVFGISGNVCFTPHLYRYALV